MVPLEDPAVAIWLRGCADVGAEDGVGDVAAGEDGDCEGAHALGLDAGSRGRGMEVTFKGGV